MDKLQIFDIPEFLKQFEHWCDVYDETAYTAYLSLSKMGKPDLCVWIYREYEGKFHNLTREDFAQLVAEPYVDLVYTRVEEIRLARLQL